MPQRATRTPQLPAPEEPKWQPPDEDSFNRTLADRVKRARKSMGKKMTQVKMAAELGIDQSTYSKYEKPGGKRKPSPLPHYLIARFCVITGESMERLLRD